MNRRTRIKICGLSRIEDVRIAVEAGTDAIGLVFYRQSPRYVSFREATSLILAIPPFVTTVGLFVNPTDQEVVDAVEYCGISILQFHGDETFAQCCALANRVNRPFMKAVRMQSGINSGNLLKFEDDCRGVNKLFLGLLLDAYVQGGYGGEGQAFDWSLIPKELAPRIVLSGGLNKNNVIDAIRNVQPYAVDVSSGVESSKGIKDPAKICAFIEAVHQADANTGR